MDVYRRPNSRVQSFFIYEKARIQAKTESARKISFFLLKPIEINRVVRAKVQRDSRYDCLAHAKACSTWLRLRLGRILICGLHFSRNSAHSSKVLVKICGQRYFDATWESNDIAYLRVPRQRMSSKAENLEQRRIHL